MLLAFLGCKSEIDNKTAATVKEPTTAVETTAKTTAPKVVTPPPAEKAKGKALSLDASSKVEWVGAKVTGDHKGGFKTVKGSATVDEGVLTALSAEIDINSLFSDNDKLTSHLLNNDFFEAPKFPTATFTSTKIEKDKIHGVLDMRAIKKEISFPATINVTAQGVDIKAEFTINRRLWKINYNGKPNDLIKDDVLIKLDAHYK